MAVLGVDIGGTKIASGIFDEGGQLLGRSSTLISASDLSVPEIIKSEIELLLSRHVVEVDRVGVCIPGIYYADRGTVWAPNIPGWTDYPLRDELGNALARRWPIRVDSDRACYVLGEEWQGRARGCKNVIFLAVGTGIGAGILVDGRVLRGVGDAAGAIGWLALDRPYRPGYETCGCFEHHASGAGIANVARSLITCETDYRGWLGEKDPAAITASDVFAAYEDGDAIAARVVDDAVSFWGMAVANLVSLFNPEIIVFGGGVFGPGSQFLPRIRDEARRWAQPISITQVEIEATALGADAGLYGAARLALMETT
jgi:glucokinase